MVIQSRFKNLKNDEQLLFLEFDIDHSYMPTVQK